MDIKQINSAIMLGDWTNDQLNSMIDAIKWNRANLAKDIKRTLKVGSQVRFNSNKLGMVVDGTITKVAVKYATVNTNRGLWKVPMNMLEAA